MKVLALITPTAGTTIDMMKPHLADEARQSWQLYKRDFIRELYLIGEGRPGAVAILESPSLREAEEAMSCLPLVTARLASVDCIALAPFGSWEALFAR